MENLYLETFLKESGRVYSGSSGVSLSIFHRKKVTPIKIEKLRNIDNCDQYLTEKRMTKTRSKNNWKRYDRKISKYRFFVQNPTEI